MNLAKKGQFHFSFFKVDSKNPKFNLEYIISQKQWVAWGDSGVTGFPAASHSIGL